ncbi:fasciclin-like arabinogalactan protein 21 [Salvia miltiorrhiza]|uniref:fasciclin-like arabinogalactan protein 21 n=1 Tax=Salvia miltiorrhiza TaxID=226208 RepID=UPI0025AC1F94|nr:fasciclin-like arabinogalactan protein 21 [Salvia miltiorrhiza]
MMDISNLLIPTRINTVDGYLSFPSKITISHHLVCTRKTFLDFVIFSVDCVSLLLLFCEIEIITHTQSKLASAMAADSSCSHWWHAPLYLGMSLTLALMAISSAKYPSPIHPLPPPIPHALAFNASTALRLRGAFHITATLLQISPELFLSSPETTLFAIQDSAISNLSLPPSTMRHLLRFHAVPAALPMAELSKKPTGFCFNTLAHDDDRLAITTNNDDGTLMINHVLVSHPDMFLQGPLAVHGVAAPFDTTPPSCRLFNQSSVFAGSGAVEWRRIVRVLSSNGFVSFAIGLNAVLDGILRDYSNLASVTVFAPPNFEFLSSPSPLLDRIVRLHILQRSFSYVELSAAGNSSLATLLPNSHLQITHFSPNLAVNGVQITRPHVFSSTNLVVHGISRDFDFQTLFE